MKSFPCGNPSVPSRLGFVFAPLVRPLFCGSRGRLERALQRPPDRRFPDLVFLRELGHCLAGGVPVGDLAALTDIEGGGPAELLAVGAGLGDAFLAPCRDQLPLKLGDAGHDGDDQLADVGCCVAPGLAERDEATGAFLEIVEDIQQVPARPRQAV
jgi:hypothetical protein